MLLRSKVLISLVLAIVPVLSGCGNEGPERFSISGQVSFEGQPVENGDIVFSPLDETTGIAAGSVIVNGRYEVDASSGPTVGTYTVDITAQRPSGKKNAGEGTTPPADLMEQYIPDVYNDATTLKVEIIDDRDDLDFNLKRTTSPPKRH